MKNIDWLNNWGVVCILYINVNDYIYLREEARKLTLYIRSNMYQIIKLNYQRKNTFEQLPYYNVWTLSAYKI